MVEVRANGFILDVRNGEKIKYIKQVADLADLSSSNASTTTSFKLPKSPNNTQVLQSLGIVGDGSRIPYERVVAQLLNDGMPIVKSGWLEIKNTNDAYNANIKDGIIDFFKAIEGKKLGVDVDLRELNHVKTVQTVVDSFSNEFYTYLVNDYGGRTVLDLGGGIRGFNIDYLVPSARIQYLWQRVFETIGFTFSGSIFSNEDFTNAWLTFPKTNSELISTNVANFEVDSLPPLFGGFTEDFYGLEYVRTLPILFTLIDIVVSGYIQIVITPNRLQSISLLQTGSYHLKVNFDAMAGYRFRYYANPNVTGVYEAPLKIAIFKNGEMIQQIIGSEEVIVPISVQGGDVISFKMYALTHAEFNTWRVSQDLGVIPQDQFFLSNMEDVEWGDYRLEIDEVEYAESDFNNTFKDFDIKSFIKEVMWRFALVAIPDEQTNHVSFYTIDELLDESRGIINWSDKYVRRTNESYLLGNYQKNNWLRHKYNTEDVSYNDGNIPLNNANLDFETTLLTSKTYSPEELPVFLYKIPVPEWVKVFPTLIWQKEIKETSDGEIEISYKGLTGRYYWLKKEVKTNAIFTSEQLGAGEVADYFNAASILDTTFSDLTSKYHQGHIRLLNDIKLHDIELSLSISDIVQVDFTRLYYFEQEASYYKLNKITWEEGKNAMGEFIRVKR